MFGREGVCIGFSTLNFLLAYFEKVEDTFWKEEEEEDIDSVGDTLPIDNDDDDDDDDDDDEEEEEEVLLSFVVLLNIFVTIWAYLTWSLFSW